MRTIFLFLFSIMIASGISSCRAETDEQPTTRIPTFRKDGVLQIHSPEGKLKAEFDIEIASSDKELMQGLKYRESMEENQGMLFVFDQIDYHSFWMQDTYLSLDMIFIDHYDTIVSIAKNTAPYSEEPIFPEKPNRYVLEVLAGITDKYDIKEADVVTWTKD